MGRRGRSGFRRSGGGGGSGGSGLYLPASVVEYWHSEIACTSGAWVGQVQGISITGVNTPTVAADGANFNGRQVAQATVAGSKNWRVSGLPTVLAVGTRPWLFAVARVRALGVTGTAVGYGRPAGSHDCVVQNVAGAPDTYRGFFLGTIASSSPTGSDTNPHRFKAFLDGANANLTVDNTTYQAATAASLGGNVTALGVGVNAADGASGFLDASVAFWLLCSAKPTAAEEALLDAWAKSYWGVP